LYPRSLLSAISLPRERALAEIPEWLADRHVMTIHLEQPLQGVTSDAHAVLPAYPLFDFRSAP
jgi:hypothetical protein